MRLSSKSKASGVILSYVLLIFQTLSTLLLTRFYLSQLGTDTYGLYQMIYAVAHYILILDLGISITLVRYITEFDTKGNHQQSENFAFHFLLIVIALIIVIMCVGICININLEKIYSSLTSEEYILAHKMFIAMVFQIAFTVISHYFRGIALAYEQFVFTRFLSIIQILCDTILIVLLVKFGMGVMGIVVANTVVIIAVVLIYMLYDFGVLKFKIKLHYWNFEILRPAGMLMFAMLLQSIVGHVNNTVDKTILGIMLTKTDVAIYSIAATFITMFNSMPTAISSVFQPKATRIVINGASKKEMTDFVIVPGRFQFMIVGAFIAGFFLFGKDFILCWTGKKEMLEAWKYVLIIMIPNSIPLIQNTTLSLLNALDKRMFRSVILALLTILNVGLTIIFINYFGAIGAPLGTAISYIVGHIVIMNIYYQRVIGLEIKRLFTSIFSKTWICIIISTIICCPLVIWNNSVSWGGFVLKGLCFSIIYGLLLLKFGFNESEKLRVNGMLKKIKNIKR